jgi:hypothetical protein
MSPSENMGQFLAHKKCLQHRRQLAKQAGEERTNLKLWKGMQYIRKNDVVHT